MEDRFNEMVLAKQLELIFKHLPMGVITTTINSSIISFLLWNVVPRILIVSWLTAQLGFALFRIVLVSIFKSDTEKIAHANRWKKVVTTVVVTSGVFWGTVSFFGILHDYFIYQVIVAIVLGGMSAGAATIYSALRKTYYGFLIPTLLPQIVILFFEGSTVLMALSGMLLLFGIVISFSAETNFKIISSNFVLQLKNEDLIQYLRKSNEKARFELVRRKQIEYELLKSKANLEQKVKDRTVELSRVNDGLKTQIKRRVRVEKELRESEVYYRSIVETAQEGIWIIDDKHKINYTNKKMAQLLGYSTDELQGKDICEFLDPSQKQFHLTDRRKRGIRQKNLRKNDGTLVPVIEAESSMIDHSGLHSVKLGMVTDITDRQIWENKIINLNDRLQETNRELFEFSHSVSHDLRTPIHTIQAFCRLILDEYANALNENGKHYLSIILKSADRMNDIIRDLLTLSKVSSAELHKEKVDLSVLADDIIGNLLSQEPTRNVKVKIGRNINAYCDSGLIRILLENLLNNSWKFTSKKSETEIRFDVDFIDNRPVFYVADNGAGFNMKYKEKLFQPFQRLHAASEFPGTGIGLATVQRIISKHGGNIWAESEKNKGATFYFTL